MPSRLIADVLKPLLEATARQDGDDAASDLLEDAPRQFGVLAAGLAGHDEALDIALLELGPQMFDLSCREQLLDELRETDQRPSDYLCTLLNADEKLVERRMEEIEQSVEGSDAVADCWYAVLLLRRIARMIYGRRLGLKQQDWTTVLGMGETAGENYGIQVSPWPSNEPDLVEVFVTVPVPRYRVISRETSKSCIDGSSIADKLHDMQDQANSIEDQSRTDDGRMRLRYRFELRFSSPSAEKRRVLRTISTGDPQVSQVSVTACPVDMAPVVARAASRDQAQRDSSLCETVLEFQARGSDASRRIEGLISRAFSDLISAAVFDEPRLRYCQMPRGWKTWADYHLGKKDSDVEKCNTFHVPTRQDRQTCGEGVCVDYAREVYSLNAALEKRAKTLAFRKADADPEYDLARKVWSVVRNHTDDPRVALEDFPGAYRKAKIIRRRNLS